MMSTLFKWCYNVFYMKYNTDKLLKSLKNIQCFILDMDGTFNLGNTLIEGSLDFYNHLIANGKRIVFLTNNSSKSGSYYVDKMNKLKCNITIENVFTSGMATCMYLKNNFPNKRTYLLGNQSLKEEFIQSGINLVENNPDIVVVGYDTTLNYKKLCKTCDYVRQGLPYIATHPDYNCPTETGFIPDIGAIMSFIHASCDRHADVIVGKPYGHVVKALLEYTSLDKHSLAICGDRLYTDIKTGVDHNLLSICVLTGETTLSNIETSKTKPDLIFDRLSSMIKYI